MNFNFSDLIKTVNKENNYRNIGEIFIKELEKGIGIMCNNEIKEYTVDRFEEDMAVCEDRETKEIINIKITELPKEIKEGNIIIYKDGKFSCNNEKEQEVEKRIKEKMDNLWNN